MTPTAAGVRTARFQLVCCVGGLAVLAAGLPGPRTVLAVLTDHPLDSSDGSLGWSTTETAILSAASLLVWVLLIWGLAIGTAAMVGRLPGAPGLAGRSLLRRIAPAAAVRLVAVAVGVGVLAGTSACSVPALTALTSAASTSAAPTSAAPTSTAPTSTAPASTAPTSTAPTSTAPASAAPTSATPTSAAQTSAAPTPGLSGALPTESSDSVIASIGIDWPDPGRPGATPTAVVPTGAMAGPTTTAPETPISTTPAPPASSTGSADQAADGPGSAAGPSTPTDATPPPSGAPDAASGDRSSEPPAPPGTGEAGAADPGTVTVAPGDSLWSIAAAHLPADSSDAAIDTAWRAWFSANRQAIGDDPDLIVPGQLLMPPNAK